MRQTSPRQLSAARPRTCAASRSARSSRFALCGCARHGGAILAEDAAVSWAAALPLDLHAQPASLSSRRAGEVVACRGIENGARDADEQPLTDAIDSGA